MQLVRLAFLTLAAAIFSFAADITGKWTSEINTDNGPVHLTLDLKMDGEKLTGTVTTHMGEMSIKEGKVSGDELTWITIYERDGNQMRLLNKAKLNGAEMKVITTVEGREDRRYEYVAKKSS
ncbi:MAG: hypothetical protein HYX27_24645 [Acidobacteria bacterium]|nr:hypothetical protein [Acidobacteriota bacterium]